MGDRVLLFDLDGTISNPLLGIARSMNFALSHFGYETHEEESLAQYIGPPLDETFPLLTGTKNSERVLELIEKFRERYREVGYAENTIC